ncbi:hypothetical protein Pyn_28820 [Prunus yedoensis var. nudiflora]|uniref:NADP-dependent oxidoreductase domain-containing protein n=1 Tax=Prunus yedoensis var. nudiflora TaxID=2094558 RepID=A0A314ZBI7_PRUYE|nr:hypothetical protein Pyn_28820 [Prunus yedoensis var. nudiflora]
MDAVEVGYHHFDTAAFYQSEQAIGRAVVQALERGLIKSRDEIFITSKLWCTDASQSYSPCPQHHTPIILRSIIQQGPSAVPRSFNKERMKQNLEIFDWELGEDEMNKINQIPHRRLYAGDFFVYEVGP